MAKIRNEQTEITYQTLPDTPTSYTNAKGVQVTNNGLTGIEESAIRIDDLIPNEIRISYGINPLLQVVSNCVINQNLSILANVAHQNIGANAKAIIGGAISQLDDSAQFQINGSGTGFLPARRTTAERNAISSPADGLQVYDTDEKANYYYDGTTWKSLCVSIIENTARLSTQQVGETYSPSFTLTAGSNRFVVLGIGVDNYGTADWSDIKYAGKSMRRIVGARQSFDNNVLDFFYILEQDLIGITGSNSIVITFIAQPDNANKMGYIWGVYDNVNQITPFKTIHKIANQTASQLDVDILDCSIDDHVIGIAYGDDNLGTFVVSSPFTKRTEALFQTGRVAISDAVATATTTNCEYTSSGAPGIGIVGFGLRGINK